MAANKKPNPQNATLLTAGKQYMKTKYFYDGSDRCSYIVQASKDADDGEPAMVTKFTYVGATSQIEASTEYEGVWDEAWDIAEDTPA